MNLNQLFLFLYMLFSPLEKLDLSSSPPSRRPLAIMSLFMLITLGIGLARLFELTVVRGKENRARADENRILVRPIHAPRGVILDRNGISLTRNVPSIREIDLPGDDLGPVPIEEAARSYPFGPALAHAIGYIGEVSPEELEACRFQKTQNTQKTGESESQKIRESDSGLSDTSDSQIFWRSEFSEFSGNCQLSTGDIVGKSGLEKQYDFLLRGTDGAELIEVDANGKTLRTLATQAPISGRNLAVNLDSNLSVAALTALSGKKGAVAAVDPADGSILALVSSPSFDPQNIISALADSENLPLFNRAAGGEYPPGSIFKLVTASAGLSENKISASTLIEDTGEIRVGDFRYGNWYFDQYGRTEGAINITRAIARSNDIFFYRVGEWLGPQALADWARRLGLGQKTGIDLPSEAAGLIPDPAWKELYIGEKWYLGNTYHMAIGQGDVRVTPLQVAQMASAVITGRRCAPRIANSEFRIQNSELKCEDVYLSDENRQLILSGMVDACSTGGTAFPFFPWNESGNPAMVACKTGTAQHGGKTTLPHAWVAAAAPIISPSHPEAQRSEAEGSRLDLDSPKRVVLVVLVEESGEGSAVAAPLAKQILTEWFK